MEVITPPLPPIVIGADDETYFIQAGNLAPPLVCTTTALRGVDGNIVSKIMLRDDGIEFYRNSLLDPRVILAIHNAPFDLGDVCNEDPRLVPLVFDAYRDGRIVCSIVRQKLIDIALGMRKFRRQRVDGHFRVTKTTYFLADLIQLYYGETLKKEDTWRLSYALLDGVPLDQWPPSAKEYAGGDGVQHLRLHEAHEQQIIEVFGGDLPDQIPQQRAAWVLHLMSMWGLRAEDVAVDRFLAHCDEEIEKMRVALEGTGIFKAKWRCAGRIDLPNGEREGCEHTAEEPWQTCPRCGQAKCKPNREAGRRSMTEIRKRVVESCARKGVAVPMTDPSGMYPEGQVQTDKEALEETDDPALHVLAAQMTFAKHKGQWGPVVKAAVLRPVCCRYDSCIETGRTASSGSEGQEGTNIQNPPRKGDVRPCFCPRHGWAFCSTDADTIELRAHAQNCLEMVGWSRMAEALWDQHQNGGPDLHLRLAASILGISKEEAVALKKAGDLEILLARQFAKIPNFGLPGGLGAETLVTYAAGQLDREMHRKWFGSEREEQIAKAKWIRGVWFNEWPENDPYFNIVGKMIDRASGEGVIRQLMSGRIRGGVRFTAAANGFFQGRVADGMKEVLWHLAMECYTGRCTATHTHGGSSLCTHEGRSILYGSRPAIFLHDEPIVEHPMDGTESDRAERQRQIVVAGLSRWMPDVPITSSAVLMLKWQKGAEPLVVNGKLVPVKPEKVKGADGKEKIRWIEDRLAA